MKLKSILLTTVTTLSLTSATMAQVPNYVPSNGLVGWWPFTGNANDLSVNGNNGTVNGAILTADRFGVSNSAYSFDGSSRIDIGALSNQIGNPNSAWSVNCWFKSLGSLNGDMVMVSDYSSNSGGDQVVSTWLALWSYTFNNKVGSTLRNTPNGWDALSTNSYNDNQWHSMVSVSEYGLLKLYIDGILINAINYNNNTNFLGSPYFRFGALLFNGQLDSYFQGQLDDIGIWNRALTQCEIKDLYNAQLNSSTSIQAGTDVSICEGNDVIFNGSGGSNYTWNNGVQNGVAYTPTISQEYIVIGQDANNCYGTDTIYVELIPNTTATQTETALDSYTWPINSQTYTQSGTYTAVIPNAAGCDSTITLDLSLDFTGINEFSEDNLFTVFPNPAQSVINVNADSKLIGHVYSIYDNTGRVVLTGKLNSQNTIIELGALSGGIYMFSVGENMKQTFKVIKE